MALPTKSQVTTLDYPCINMPFIQVGAKSGIDINTLDFPASDLAITGNNDTAAAVTVLVSSWFVMPEPITVVYMPVAN